MKSNFLFAAWPYIVLSLLLVGLAVRYFLDRRQMDSVKKEMSEAWAVFGGGKIWQMSLLLLLALHLTGLLFPHAVLSWNGSAGRLYLLEAAGFILGLLALVSWCSLMWRHLGHSNRSAVTELSDTVFLSLLLVSMLSGILTAALYRWGSTWGALTLSPYVVSLVRAKPTPGLASQMPFMVRLHIFSSFAALAVFPLTRLAAFPIFAMGSAFGLAGRFLASGARALEAWMRKHSPAGWLWPEED